MLHSCVAALASSSSGRLTYDTQCGELFSRLMLALVVSSFTGSNMLTHAVERSPSDINRIISRLVDGDGDTYTLSATDFDALLVVRASVAKYPRNNGTFSTWFSVSANPRGGLYYEGIAVNPCEEW